MSTYRAGLYDPEARRKFAELCAVWLDKMPEGSKRFQYVADYYLYARPGDSTVFMPVFFPHAIAADLSSLKGKSMGDFIEVYREPKGKGPSSMGVTHLNLYVTARFLWDAGQDVDALLDEYYTLFYGPAAKQMKAFVDYSEKNWMNLKTKPEALDETLALLAAARKAAGDTVYGKRVDLVADYVNPLKRRLGENAVARMNAPQALAVERSGAELKVDGKLDEAFWQGAPTYELKDLTTGGAASVQDHLPGGLGQQVPMPGHPLRGGGHEERHGDDREERGFQRLRRRRHRIVFGDPFPCLLPDRGQPGRGGDGHRLAERARDAVGLGRRGLRPKGERFLDCGNAHPHRRRHGGRARPVEMRGRLEANGARPVVLQPLPPAAPGQGRAGVGLLPHGQLRVPRAGEIREVGRKVRGGAMLGKAIVAGMVWSCCVCASADYLADRKEALALSQSGKHAEALALFTAMAAGAASDLQKADALEQAAYCADRLKQSAQALALAQSIPLQAVSKQCHMNLLLANQKYRELVAEFKAEDIAHWPESSRGGGFHGRGMAYYHLKDGKAAEADLRDALPYLRDEHTPGVVWLTLGNNYRDQLQDDQKALDAYAQAAKKLWNGSGYYYSLESVLASASILCKQGKPGEALRLLGELDMKKQKGDWAVKFLRAYGEALGLPGEV